MLTFPAKTFSAKIPPIHRVRKNPHPDSEKLAIPENNAPILQPYVWLQSPLKTADQIVNNVFYFKFAVKGKPTSQ